MKTMKSLPILAIVLALALVSCSKDDTTTLNSGSDEQELMTAEKTVQIIDSLPFVQPDSAEASFLQFLRSEEYLAHDVYALFSEKYGLVIFGNIMKSELRHTTAIQRLLEKYSIFDPESEHVAGVYANPELQELYDQLVASGSASSLKALEAGKAIEITDIGDIDLFIPQTDKEDILFVLNNLRAGSERHLKAFNAWLAAN
jgi:hypothetical protein